MLTWTLIFPTKFLFHISDFWWIVASTGRIKMGMVGTWPNNENRQLVLLAFYCTISHRVLMYGQRCRIGNSILISSSLLENIYWRWSNKSTWNSSPSPSIHSFSIKSALRINRFIRHFSRNMATPHSNPNSNHNLITFN